VNVPCFPMIYYAVFSKDSNIRIEVMCCVRVSRVDSTFFLLECFDIFSNNAGNFSGVIVS
jgi:hypothetical protein